MFETHHLSRHFEKRRKQSIQKGSKKDSLAAVNRRRSAAIKRLPKLSLAVHAASHVILAARASCVPVSLPYRFFTPVSLHRKAASYSYEVIQQIVTDWALQDDWDAGYQAGQIVGLIIFEVAAFIIPFTKVGQVSKLTVLEHLREAKTFEEGYTAARILDSALAKLGFEANGMRRAGSFAKALQTAEEVVGEVFTEFGKIIKGHISDNINVYLKDEYKYILPPFKPGTTVFEVRTTVQTNVRLVRLYNKEMGNLERGWLVRYDDLFDANGQLLTQTELMKRLNIPSTNGYIVDTMVEVRPGVNTKLFIGEGNVLVEGGEEGVTQIFVDQEFDPTWVLSNTEKGLPE